MKNDLRLQIALLALLRTVFNTGYRMVYPFLPVFARGLGVELSVITLALTGRALVGAVGPFLATIADQRGRRAAMMLGGLIFAIGSVLVIVWPSFWPFTVSIILAFLGKIIFDPAMHAYIGDRIPYHQRGGPVAIIEMSWSFSFILGIPLVGVLMARYGWSSPFIVFTVLGLVTVLVLCRFFPANSEVDTGNGQPELFGNLRAVFASGPALAALTMSLLMATGNELVNVVFGVWIEGSFGLKIAALGAASAVIGLSELGGEGLAGFLSDRIGKARAIALGLTVNSLAALALPWLGSTLPGALVGLFLFYIGFEFTLVCSLPLLTEVLPGARATLIASTIAAYSLGRAVGTSIATPLFTLGIAANTTSAVLFNLLALLALSRLVGHMRRKGSLVEH